MRNDRLPNGVSRPMAMLSSCMHEWKSNIPPLTQAPIQDEGYVYKYCMLYYSCNSQKVYVQGCCSLIDTRCKGRRRCILSSYSIRKHNSFFHCYSRGNLQRNVYGWFACYLTHCVSYRLSMLDRFS